jgi:hypothetical protein
VTNLAKMGQGRALLGLGQYAAAAAVVAAVPDGYKYALHFDSVAGHPNFFGISSNTAGEADSKGFNGLNYRSSGDPRTPAVLASTNAFGYRTYRPANQASGSSPIVLASAVEARLIEAEAALQAGDAATWLTKLNALRTGGTADTIADTLGVTGCDGTNICPTNDPSGPPLPWTNPAYGQPAGGFPVPAGYTLARTDTIKPVPPAIVNYCNNYSWYQPCFEGTFTLVYVYVLAPMGTGQVPGLSALTDPGTPEGRVDLLFRERAFWLYLTGHRQGDLRRLIRQYGRQSTDIYPIGPYPGSGSAFYEDFTTVPVPVAEQTLNPKFTGCFSRDA